MATTPRPLQTIKSRPVVRPLIWRKKRYMGQQLAKLQPMVCSRLAALLHQGVVLLTTMDRPDAARWPCRSPRRAGWHNVVSGLSVPDASVDEHRGSAGPARQVHGAGPGIAVSWRRSVEACSRPPILDEHRCLVRAGRLQPRAAGHD